jgi:hypothetical protein
MEKSDVAVRLERSVSGPALSQLSRRRNRSISSCLALGTATYLISPIVSAARASRCPIARGGPSVESLRVCFSDCALITAPNRTISADR